MKKKLNAFAIVILCMISIIMTGTIMLDENEEISEDTKRIVSEDITYYACSGISRTISESLENMDYTSLSMEQNDNIEVKDSYYEEEAIQESEIRYEEVSVDKTAYVSVDLLNMRSEFNTNSEILVVLNYGEELKIIGEMVSYKNDEPIDYWMHVYYDGLYGYVKAEYLTDQLPYYSLGTYDITYYCPCAICCGVETGITASGAIATAGVTCAADPSIPFGTELIIDGHTYIVQDRGGMIKGNHIDIYCNSHQEALNNARHDAEVFVKVNN